MNDERLIKEFRIDNSKKSFVHPLFPNKLPYYENGLNIYLLTLGHLWLYKIIERYGNGIYLNQIMIFAENKENTLFEWELSEDIKRALSSILLKHNISITTYLSEDFDIKNYDNIIRDSKDSHHIFHTITRAIFLAKHKSLVQIAPEIKSNKIIDWEGISSLVNATFLGLWSMKQDEGTEITPIPDVLKSLVEKNMECYTHQKNLKYYPQVDYILNNIADIESHLSPNWYLISENEQVLFGKLLYSLRMIKELCINPIGLNGILSTFVTRSLFDNFWQSKYLIQENKIEEYRLFALDRMRLHIIKRSDMPKVNSINDLLSEVESGIFDPIPINGDYFTKSAREYSIQLNIKDEYDKYYEYNSEFIHTSLTAIYSSIMCKCSNPEHNAHLTINPNNTNYVDCATHIFEIMNLHIELINNYFEEEIFSKFELNQVFFQTYEEHRKFVNKIVKRVSDD